MAVGFAVEPAIFEEVRLTDIFYGLIYVDNCNYDGGLGSF